MRIKKLSRIMGSFVLSAALLAEPVGSMPVIYAQEEQVAEQDNTDSSDSQQEIQDSNEQDDVDEETLKTEENKDTEGELPTDTDLDEQPDENGEEVEKEEPDSSEGNVGEETDSLEEDTEEEVGDSDDIDGSLEDDAVEDTNEEDENASDREDDSTAEEESEMEAVDELFSDMPAGYQLTSLQREWKADMADAVDQLQDSDEGVDFASGRVVTFADSREEAEMIAEAYHAEIETFEMGVLTLKLGEGRTVKEAVKAAASQDNALPAVWPDYRRELYGEMSFEVEDDTPSVETYAEVFDELYGERDPYLDSASDRYQWFHTVIGSPYAWDAGYTGQSVTVGVIDSGVSPNPDLDANVSGRYDFCDGTPDALDCRQHGTHVAGIIAALANGTEGTGVAPDAKIFNAKVFGEDASKSG